MSAGHFVYEHLPAIGLGERDPIRPFVTGGLGVTITISVGPFDIIVMSLGIAQKWDLASGIRQKWGLTFGIRQEEALASGIRQEWGLAFGIRPLDDIVSFTVGINTGLDTSLGVAIDP